MKAAFGFSGVIAGSDASGIVEESGTGVKGFEVGDIVGTYDHVDTDLDRATVGLSFKYTLKIPKTGNENDYILIWGGASATGILAIQIAKLVYNLKVITTCSEKNADFVKFLGADTVFDYRDETVVDKIKAAASGKLDYVLDTVSSEGTLKQAYDATIGSPTKAFDCLTVAKPKVDPFRNISTVTSLVYAALGEDTFGSNYFL